jgi:hypothetical protein
VSSEERSSVAVRNFVQYHNTEKMGHECGEGEADTFELLTDKGSHHLLGNRVWLIAGKGQPRRYFLCERFVVDEVVLDETGRFTWSVRGKRGEHFKPWLPLDSCPWFHGFRESQQNFSLGLREVGPEYVAEFEELARAYAR